MKESIRISQLFKDLFEGDPWLGVNIMSTLGGISAERAAVKIAPERNSIWEIVNHMTSWRLNVLQRFEGEVIPSPEHNYILPVETTTEAAVEELDYSGVVSSHSWSTPDAYPRIYELGGPDVDTFRELMQMMNGIIQRRRAVVNVPFPLARLMAWVFGLGSRITFGLTPEPLTSDQVGLALSELYVDRT